VLNGLQAKASFTSSRDIISLPVRPTHIFHTSQPRWELRILGCLRPLHQ
jgi:hypothetical protein